MELASNRAEIALKLAFYFKRNDFRLIHEIPVSLYLEYRNIMSRHLVKTDQCNAALPSFNDGLTLYPCYSILKIVLFVVIDRILSYVNTKVVY